MVIWSDEAKADLHHIFDFIAKDSKHYGLKVIQNITAKTDILDELPRIGRVVPEIFDENVREIPIYSYRIIYEIMGQNVSILAIAHKRRKIKADYIGRK